MTTTSSPIAAAPILSSSTARVARGRFLLPLAALGILSWLANSSYAVEIVSIEEHWELRVGLPDVDSSSPQVSMVMSPTGNLNGDYFVFALNHHSIPEWVPGGLQVQHWNGEEVAESKVGPQEGLLHHSNESVAWVQRTSLQDGQLVFEIVNGVSESWGNFGSQGHLRFAFPTQLANLNEYRPAVSIEESGVSFGGNRVGSLVLQKLRWTDSAGNSYELTAPIDVDADLDP